MTVHSAQASVICVDFEGFPSLRDVTFIILLHRLLAGMTLTAIKYGTYSWDPVFSKEWPKGPGLVPGLNLCHNHSSQVNKAFTLLQGKNIRGDLSFRLKIVKLGVEQGRLTGHDGKGYTL